MSAPARQRWGLFWVRLSSAANKNPFGHCRPLEGLVFTIRSKRKNPTVGVMVALGLGMLEPQYEDSTRVVPGVLSSVESPTWHRKVCVEGFLVTT